MIGLSNGKYIQESSNEINPTSKAIQQKKKAHAI